MYKTRFSTKIPSEVNELFNSFFGPLEADPKHKTWVNIKETEGSYLLEVLAPGCKKDDFDLSIDGRILTVTMEVEKSKETPDSNYLRREWGTQSFERKFTLKDDSDLKSISAKYENGILLITISKLKEKELKSSKIEIK